LQADGPALAEGSAREALRQAMQQLSAAEDAVGSGRTAGLCQAHTGVARALSHLHAYSSAESHLAQALHWGVVMGATDVRADLHCALSEVATNAAELAELRGESPDRVRRARDRSRDHVFEAARLAGHTADPHWEVKLLLRASDVLDRCGDHDDAVQLQQRALVLMGLHSAELASAIAAAQAGDNPAGNAVGTLM